MNSSSQLPPTVFARKMLKTWISLGVLLVVVVVGQGQGSPPFQLDDQRGLPALDLELIPSSRASDSSRIRLPSAVVPENYYVDIITILEDNPPEGFTQFTAPGYVRIQMKCLEPTHTITLHSKEIEFTQDNVTVWRSLDGQGVPLNITNVTFDAELEQVTITLDQPLIPRDFYMIAINFLTQINEGLSGLYQSSYRDADGKERFLATTQCESTGARRIFPCFDEPHFRAIFIIKIGYKQNLIAGDNRPYHALSNMARNGDPVPIQNMAGYYWQNFKSPNVNMPSYLIAIIVSDFTSVQSVADPTVKTWGQTELMVGNSGVFSANAAQKVLTFFTTFFDIEYPKGMKLDSVAVPDFAAGAMENWGLNTYRVPTVLFVTGDMTQFERWRQAAVIAHEVAHSWYGNLVTINWWNDLWLKEGFARYLQFHGVAGGVEFSQPTDNFGAKDRMVLDTVQLAMENDIGPNTHPVHGESTTEMRATNSRIIYEKGASLIRMMQTFLNTDNVAPTTFQSGLRQFLHNHDMGSAEQDDLFAALQEIAEAHHVDLQGRTVKEIMDTWTNQDGFPLIRVDRVATNRIFVSQRKYVADPGAPAEGSWEVPIAYILKKDNPADPDPQNYLPQAWMGANQSQISISVNTANNKWILVNPEAMSYYRVLYDEHLFNMLKNELDSGIHTAIPTASRSQLLDDHFNFAFHSHASITWALDLTKYLGAKEATYPVWTTALTHLRKLYNFLRGSDTTGSVVFENFKTYLGVHIAAVLGSPDSHDPAGWMLKALLLDWGCTLDHALCGSKTEALMNAWVAGTKVQADVQPMVFCAAYRRDADPGPAWRTLMEVQYANHAVNGIGPNQHRLLYSARGCASKVLGTEPESPNSLDTLLLETIHPDSNIPGAHRKALITQIAGRDDGIDETLEFLELNYATIISRLGDDAITTAIRTISTYTASLETERRIQKFHDDREDEVAPAVATSLRDSIVIIQRNREWNTKFSEEIGEWLEDWIR